MKMLLRPSSWKKPWFWRMTLLPSLAPPKAVGKTPTAGIHLADLAATVDRGIRTFCSQRISVSPIQKRFTTTDTDRLVLM